MRCILLPSPFSLLPSRFYLWAFISVLVLVLNTLYPVLIAPFFNTFTPLEDGPVRAGIEKLIADTGLNCKKVFMVDGSKQSNHSNAYVAGLCGSKRIVIYDTLIKDLKEVRWERWDPDISCNDCIVCYDPPYHRCYHIVVYVIFLYSNNI